MFIFDNLEAEIQAYIDSQPEAKRAEMTELHTRIVQSHPGCKLWFDDGKAETGKIVSNPNIGYGRMTIRYSNGTTKEWFRASISGNTMGISVYILGITDKNFLAETFGKALGKASVSGYCIKFKSLKVIDIEVLLAAIGYGLGLPTD